MGVPVLVPSGGIPEGDAAERVRRVLETMSRLEGRACSSCGGGLCDHERLACIPSGHADRPLCLPCLAGEVGRPLEVLRDELVGFVLSKECLTVGWRWANLREEEPADATRRCLWGEPLRARGPSAGTTSREAEPAARGAIGPTAEEWDAGDLACGDLLLELRFRLDAMAPGTILRLTARDAGAREDLPAWCRLTGHSVLAAQHPAYWIRRRE